MEGIISVAVIESFFALLHFLVMDFCIIGIFWNGMFLPRSPLAIIIPSDTLIRLLMLVTPFWFSIFEIIWSFGNWDFIWEISLADSAKDIAR